MHSAHNTHTDNGEQRHLNGYESERENTVLFPSYTRFAHPLSISPAIIVRDMNENIMLSITPMLDVFMGQVIRE